MVAYKSSPPPQCPDVKKLGLLRLWRSRWRRSPTTFASGRTVALWKDSTTRSKCSSAAAMGSSTCPISSSASFWISKVTDYLPDLSTDTTTYGIFHGKYQRAQIQTVTVVQFQIIA